jgi:beta-galactosidase
MSGVEAGEWALLDFQNNPSDRMMSITSVADVINKNATLFANAKVVESNINILYIRESIWVESKLQTGGPYYDGRNRGGVMKSSLSYFEALSEMGIQSNFKEINEFDFTKEDYTGITIILSHQISIPSRYWQKLETFVSKGGKLIVDGLTGYYDEYAVCLLKDFPLQKLFGGNIKEFKTISNLFDLALTNPKLTLPTHLWKGSILPTTAKSIGTSDGEVIAVKNTFGKGEVFWAPSLMGLAQRIKGNYSPLEIILQQEAKQSIANVPFKFAKLQPGLMMKTMQSGSSYITLIINKSGVNKTVELSIKEAGKKPVVLFSDKQGNVAGKVVKIASEETMIIQW